MDRKNLLLFDAGGLIVVLGLAFFVSPLASSSRDGLNRVAIDEGFAGTEKDSVPTDGPLSGYEVKGVDDGSASRGLAGVIGVAITFGVRDSKWEEKSQSKLGRRAGVADIRLSRSGLC